MVLASVTGPTHIQYLPTIQERWNVSDLVCIGEARAAVRTGVTEFLDGHDRDQMSADVDLQTCFKGDDSNLGKVRVLDYNVFALKDIEGRGYDYAGPPTGFVHRGRNLLFLRRTNVLREFESSVLIYATAIPLADEPPVYPEIGSTQFTRVVVTRELEAALLQEDRDGAGNISDIEYLLDWLGAEDGIIELSEFSKSAPEIVQRDIAVALLSRKLQSYEPVVISLMLDSSAPCWKRENAALALGRNGTDAALAPLRQIAAQPATTQDLQILRHAATESLQSIEHRLNVSNH
jgi:hypothetical protein